MTTVEKNCLACGDLIVVRLADHKRGWGNFCDKACSYAHKCGQRPGDVNEYHAECQSGYGWAAGKLKDFAKKYGEGNKPPAAPKIKAQIGKVKVKPTYHSPALCRECGDKINGPGICDRCEMHSQAMDAIEAGWDGHKNAF
ncbi:hypothetical protein [Phaeobacter inhibens]|uniref:hypothetical protein n=1 Tax=Phaeobacter inhibens TaxID=221822 RepID=UPI000C9A856F|nr:hypothetical protein [Phaeobacter inhibens]AUQ64404.1 hypothetical protein PhaeoP51_03473 [Phaeobacter inhibens]